MPAPPPLTLDELPARQSIRTWARTWVRELGPLLGRREPSPKRRVLLIFLDGLGGTALDRAVEEGRVPFLASLLRHPKIRRTNAFSGVPSTTTAFQAGLFYGLRHPDIPGFSWFDRDEGKTILMATPKDAVWVENRLIAKAGPGFFEGGTTYLSILRGGARNFGSTAGLWPLISGPRLPPLIPGDFVGGVWVHFWTTLRVLLRAGVETPFLLRDIQRFADWNGGTHGEWRYLQHYLAISILLQEMGRSQVMFDLVRGVPRMFHCIHDYDEVSHRRGTSEARRVLGRIDRRVEHIMAVAAAVPDPPDVWIITDHGQIPSIPFEGIFGCTLGDWLRQRDGARLPDAISRTVGVSPGADSHVDPVVIDSGNYAHIYFSSDGPLDATEIVKHHAPFLARALDCPGIGLVAMRSREGAVAFAGGRRVDPKDPTTVPRGVHVEALRTFLDELPQTPSSGDIVLFGSWLDDACVAFTWEYSSHGGLSREETSIFLLHPAGIHADLSEVSHGADLHRVFSPLYGMERPPGTR